MFNYKQKVLANVCLYLLNFKTVWDIIDFTLLIIEKWPWMW